MKRVVIATIKSWNLKNAAKFKEKYKSKYETFLIDSKESLIFSELEKINPAYIFFPHWSWIIPDKIYKKFNCVVFHMTDLPYGRGGSPLQNLILNKVYNTKISAIRVESGLDAGAVYLKEPFYTGIGSAEDIFLKISDLVFFKMIPEIIDADITPQRQEGEIVVFTRRKPEESDLSLAEITTFDDFYDFVRMLDAQGYPKAFLRIGRFKIELSCIYYKLGKLEGRFEVLEEE